MGSILEKKSRSRKLDGWLIFILIGAGFLGCRQVAVGQNIIVPSDPSVTTDTLRSGELVLGINSNGGGVINYLYLPGTGNIFGPQSVKYGRSGQSAMRDALHGGRYNPTQAGFNETLGTPCSVERGADKLVIPARPVALWYGDCKWDFTEWENIGADPSCYDDGGYGDMDELDETGLDGKQHTEVKSEFDYFGKYHDYKGKGGIDIACIRHYFEYRYFREPGHCINQFRPGLSIYNEAQIHPDISRKFPAGKHEAAPFDMSRYILSWHLRNDIAQWDPAYRFVKDTSGNWVVGAKDRDGVFIQETMDEKGHPTAPRLLILSDSSSPEAPHALGLYMPPSEFNAYETVGVDERSGTILYKDNRYTSVRIWDQPRRIPTMAVYGFKMESNGILNRNRLEADVYEAFRYDVFMLMGTPDEIWATVRRIENARTQWFFQDEAHGWQGSADISETVADSILQLQINAENQTLRSPDSLLIDAGLHRYLSFRIKNQTAGNSFVVRFKRYDGDQWYQQSLSVVPGDDAWKTWTLDMSENAHWNGMIRQVEIFFGSGTGEVSFDFITATADALTDCNGDFQGGAFVDGCGDCVGGNTGKEPCEDCMGVPDGEATLNPCGDCVGGTSEWSPVNEWHFDTLDDWTLNDRLDGRVDNGFAILDIIGNDPFMNYDGVVCLDAATHHVLKLGMMNNSDGSAATLYFQNDVTGGWKHFTFQVSKGDNELKEYAVDLSACSDWEGNIHKIRFDPPGSAGTMELDYLAILPEDTTVPAAAEPFARRIRIFPNPAADKVRIEAPQPVQAAIYSLDGRNMGKVDAPEKNLIFDVKRWPAGIYLIQIWNSEGLKSKKIIVE